MAGEAKTRVSIAVSEIVPGTLLDRDIFAGDALLAAAGVTLSAKMIESFKRRGISEIEIAHDSALVRESETRQLDNPLEGVLTTVSEVYKLHAVNTLLPPQMLEEATHQVEGLFYDIELGQEVDLGKTRQLCRQLVEMLTSRGNLAAKLLDIDQHDRYTYRHSVNVGILFMLVASEWVASQDVLEDLVFGAVLHDLGKAKVGHEIINKPGKLTDEEMAVMRQHPLWSAELLLEADASPTAISIARWHHERIDGNGYPDGLKGAELDRFVRLSAVCDVYDALTTTRSYRKKMDFAKAIEIILQDCGSHFDPEVAHEFIRRVGRYPAGSFVRLSTNEVAVVLRVNEHAISRPVVSRILNADGSLRSQGEELDLSQSPEIYINAIVTTAGALGK